MRVCMHACVHVCPIFTMCCPFFTIVLFGSLCKSICLYKKKRGGGEKEVMVNKMLDGYMC